MEPQAGRFPRFPAWIIEHVWAHRMMDVQDVLDPSTWPDVDSQPLSLEDSWRLRVASAQVYSIVRNRDLENFERAIDFLETTFGLQPGLVTAIKHMKIMFGLKTMVIMWMLREGRGMIDTVSKIVQFFPSKLPQYQDRCSQREMFLMRKNHQDFKSLAQTLVMDRDRLDHYIQNQMDEQYGERYAQKVEERLLHYLQQLEVLLPGDTYIDKILKKQSPVTEEEKLLLEVITSDSTTIAATLKNLLHCDAASCCRATNSLERGNKTREISQLTKSLRSGEREARTSDQSQSEGFRGDQAAGGGVSKDVDVLLDDGSDATGEPEEGGEERKENVSQRSSGSDHEAASSPQFCRRHQRWVRSILRECPDECSEEPLLQVSSSPLLFQSSSSSSSSQDLTPSGLAPCPPDRPPSRTSTHPQRAAPVTEPVKDVLNSGSTAPQTEGLPQPLSTRDTPLPLFMRPVVRLFDIASIATFNPLQASQNHFNVSSNEQSSGPGAVPPPHRRTSANKDSTSVPPGTRANVQTAPATREASTSTSCQPPQRTFSRLSRKFRWAQAGTGRSQASAEQFMKNPSCPPLSEDFNVSEPPSVKASESSSTVCTPDTSSAKSPQRVIHQNSVKHHTRNSRLLQSETGRLTDSRVPLKLSLPTQDVLLQSKLLQPFVGLTRLSTKECYRATGGRSSTRHQETVDRGGETDEEEDDVDSSFDVNVLYSSDSSGSDGNNSVDSDPEYKPNIKRKRLLLEYESARVLSCS